MANLIVGLITILSIPLMFFNFFAGIVAFGWLGWLGDWSTVLYAFGAGVIAPFALSFPLMIALVFAAPAIWLLERGAFGKLLSMPLLLLSGMVTWVVMAGWGLFVFHHALQEIRGPEVLPYLLAAYSVTTAPWSYMASKEGPDSSVGIPLFFTQLSAAWGVLAIWLKLAQPIEIIGIYIAILGVGFLLSVLTGAISLIPAKPGNNDYD
jgi:hypothetical protein